MVAARRKHDMESLHRRAMLYLRAAAFCCVAATASEKEGTRTVIAWINEFFCMSEADAAESIAIGRRLMARDAESP
jgi:hypothetical protein